MLARGSSLEPGEDRRANPPIASSEYVSFTHLAVKEKGNPLYLTNSKGREVL